MKEYKNYKSETRHTRDVGDSMSTIREILFPDFPKSEFNSRIKRIRDLMVENEIDALLLFNPQNIRYYTGFEKVNYTTDMSWRRSVLIPKDGPVTAIVPHILYQNFLITTWAEDVRPYGGPNELSYPKNHHDVLIATINEFNLKNKTIATELDSTMMPELTYLEYEAIQRDLLKANIKIKHASGIIWQQRMIKSRYEIQLYKEVVKKACRAFTKALKNLKGGMSEKVFHALITRAYLEEGIHSVTYGSHSLITGPRRGNAYIMSYTDTILKNGDVILFDGGPIWKGYFTDFQRNICIGNPSRKLRNFYEKILNAHEAAIASVKPGIKASEVYEAAKSKCESFDMIVRFIGHGIGLQNHEPPYIEPKNKYQLKPNMIVTIEVGGYNKGIVDCALFPEDIVLVTDTGHEVLTDQLSRHLFIV